MTTSKEPTRGLMRRVALVAAVVGAAGSVGLMFRASQHPPVVLLILFTIWVVSPFVALFWANLVAKRWTTATRMTLYCITLIVALSSLAIYGDVVHVKPVNSPNAFMWVIVPPVSAVFAAIVVSMAALISSKRSRDGASA